MAAANIQGFLRHVTRDMAAEMLGDLSDQHLVQRALTVRDEASFQAIVDRHGPMVYRVCWRVLQHVQDTEDAFQATFLVLARNLRTLREHSSLASWLHGVAHRTALKCKTQSATRRSREQHATRAVSVPPDDMTWGELRAALDAELVLLPEKWRLPLVLCYLEGRTQDDAASQLKWSKSTLKRRLEEACAALGNRLKGRGFTLSTTLSAVLVADCTSPAAPTPGLAALTVKAVAALTSGHIITTSVSSTVVALAEGMKMKPMLTGRLKAAILFLSVVGLAGAVLGLAEFRLEAAIQQQPQTDKATAKIPESTELADDQKKQADAEMHVIGIYEAKAGEMGRVDVEVQPTDKPVILVLTSYMEVNWHIKRAEGARIKKVIVSGYFEQEVTGLPADVPLVNQSYYPNNGSRSKNGWFYSYQWNTPEWREVVRRLNETTGLPVTTFQGNYRGDSFIVDGKRGRDLGQKELKPRTPVRKEWTLRELQAVSVDAEMHIVGTSPDHDRPGKPIEVEVRPTSKPVILVLTCGGAIWNVKCAEGARLKAVIVGSDSPQEVEGLPAQVPVYHCCPDASLYYFDKYNIGKLHDKKNNYFHAHQWNTIEYRRMVEKLNDMTGLLVSTFQEESKGTSYVIDGIQGSKFAQKERKPRPTLPQEPTPKELLSACTNAELQVVGISGPKNGDGTPVDVEVQPATKPIVLVLTSYWSVLWNVKIAKGAQVKAVIIGGYFEQEFEGIPKEIPLVCRSYFPNDGSRRNDGWFYPSEWNTLEWREMVRRINEMTGLPVATFQKVEKGVSFIVDGKRGHDLGQKELKPYSPARKEWTLKDLQAISVDAEMHIVGISYHDRDKPGKPIEVEVRPTAKPVLLVLTSSREAIWNVKCAKGARLKAVIVGSGSPQEVEGLLAGVPLYYCCPEASTFYFGGKRPENKTSFHAHQWNTIDYRRMVEKLNDMTGLLVSSFQGESSGDAFVIDGTRGSNFAQKERKPTPAFPKEPTAQELLSACANAELHVVSIYWPKAGYGATVDVEIRPTTKPIVLALVSYYSTLWNVKIASGAQVKAIIIGGYNEQEFDGIPNVIPLVSRTYFPSKSDSYFYGHDWNERGCQKMVAKLNDLTGLSVATFQGIDRGSSFVIDGTRGSQFAQKERNTNSSKKEPVAEEDPLADVADIPSQELKAGGDANKRFFLIGPKKNSKPPEKGYGLIVVMPGGDGSADFNPFVRRIYKNAVPDGYILAQPIAVKWTKDQQIVWPTKKNPVEGMKFSTEEFVDAVIKQLDDKYKLDSERAFTMTWSSSGPAAYAVSLSSDKITGSFIAMSVFKPNLLPPLDKAKGHGYFLYHSPDDRVCPIRMAEQAEKDLKANGATVKLATYQGGHGWRGNLYDDIKEGVEWLEKNHAAPPKR